MRLQLHILYPEHKDGVGDADTLWHKTDPTLDEVIDAMDGFDLTDYEELVYCGYGEPTCALDALICLCKICERKVWHPGKGEYQRAGKSLQ